MVNDRDMLDAHKLLMINEEFSNCMDGCSG